MHESIKQKLKFEVDEKYRVFSSKLLPGVNDVMGVRLPILRKFAKSIVKEDWRYYLENAKDDSFEEVMLQGMVIGYIDCSFEERINYIESFVPKINNWSTCDSFCSGLKFAQFNQSKLWRYIVNYMNSNQEYEIRFGVVMTLFYYLDDEYIDEVFIQLDDIDHEGYYVKMAVAWAISIAFLKFPEKTEVYLKNNKLDDFTYNKALQKICESLKVDNEIKKSIQQMKR